MPKCLQGDIFSKMIENPPLGLSDLFCNLSRCPFPFRAHVSVPMRDLLLFCLSMQASSKVAYTRWVQYSTAQYSTVQYSTVQYSTVQYSTVQYSTVQSWVFFCLPPHMWDGSVTLPHYDRVTIFFLNNAAGKTRKGSNSCHLPRNPFESLSGKRIVLCVCLLGLGSLLHLRSVPRCSHSNCTFQVFTIVKHIQLEQTCTQGQGCVACHTTVGRSHLSTLP